jgi:hypothetical protein
MFSNLPETQRLDCYPGYETIDDGLAWLADPKSTGGHARIGSRTGPIGSAWHPIARLEAGVR